MVCSPRCRLTARADDRAAQRLAARVREEATVRYWQLDAPGAVSLEDVEPSLSDPLDPQPLPLVGVRLSKGGTVWDDRKATPRGKDAAAQWLAQYHPGKLADFPADLR